MKLFRECGYSRAGGDRGCVAGLWVVSCARSGCECQTAGIGLE